MCKIKFRFVFRAQDVAKAVEKMIAVAKNGSVWVAEGGELHEIRLPDYKQLQVK